MRIPKITVTGWNTGGPSYTVEHRLHGWRNRAARKAGEGAEVREGEGEPTTEPGAMLVFTRGDTEVWIFNKGHVYELDLLVDGEASSVLVDGRDDYLVERFDNGVELLGRRALTEDEVAEVEDGMVPEQPSNVSDGAESQEPLEAVVDPAGDPIDPDAPSTPAPEDNDEPSSEADYGGTITDFKADLADIDDEALLRFALEDTRKGIRDLAEAEIDRRSSTASEGDAAAAEDE